jgi:hypothetical protein
MGRPGGAGRPGGDRTCGPARPRGRDRGCRYWATDPPLARSILAFAVTDPAAAQLLAGHDAGRLRLLTRLTDRLAADGLLAGTPDRALDALWLLTGFAAYDELARGRGMATERVAGLLADLAESRVLAHR